LDGAVDVVPRCVATLEGGGQVLGADHAVGHLDVEAGGDRGGGVAQPEDPVADDEAIEVPLTTKDVGEQLTVLTAPLAVDRVVGGHDRGDAFVDDAPEVRQVHLVQGDLVDLDVDGESGVLHRVAREVLGAGEHVALETAGHGGTELADVVGVLAVGLLRPAPRRVAQHVHADGAGEGGARGAQLAPDCLADPLLELGVPGRASAYGDGEAGSVADDRSSRPVGECDAGQPDAFDLRGGEWCLVVTTADEELEPGQGWPVTVEAPETLVRCHGLHQLPGCVLGCGPMLHGVTGVVEGGDGHGAVLPPDKRFCARTCCALR
jgi:hypothetical protein